jgi:WD40 repeat protein
MKTLQVIIVLIGFIFSFNNQIFAAEKAVLARKLEVKCELATYKDSVRPVSQTVGKEGVEFLKFSNDGKLISIAYGDGTTIVYETLSGKKLFNLAGKSSSTMQSIEFSKDKKYIFGVNRNEFFKWSSRDGSLILNETFYLQEKKGYDKVILLVSS